MKKLVVITGASSGIGQATALRFSALGHPLLLLARRVERLEDLNLPNCICSKVDVANLDSFQQAVSTAENKFGKTDLIINNAGVMLLGKIQDQAPEEWQTMLNTNVLGVLNGIRVVLPQMIEQNGGTIINISSTAGKVAMANYAVYCATKHAVQAITESARRETAHLNIRILTVSPGVVETELLQHITNKSLADSCRQWIDTTMQQGLNADDIAKEIGRAHV